MARSMTQPRSVDVSTVRCPEPARGPHHGAMRGDRRAVGARGERARAHHLGCDPHGAAQGGDPRDTPGHPPRSRGWHAPPLSAAPGEHRHAAGARRLHGARRPRRAGRPLPRASRHVPEAADAGRANPGARAGQPDHRSGVGHGVREFLGCHEGGRRGRAPRCPPEALFADHWCSPSSAPSTLRAAS
jgi:hypothetical protein